MCNEQEGWKSIKLAGHPIPHLCTSILSLHLPAINAANRSQICLPQLSCPYVPGFCWVSNWSHCRCWKWNSRRGWRWSGWFSCALFRNKRFGNVLRTCKLAQPCAQCTCMLLAAAWVFQFNPYGKLKYRCPCNAVPFLEQKNPNSKRNPSREVKSFIRAWLNNPLGTESYQVPSTVPSTTY